MREGIYISPVGLAEWEKTPAVSYLRYVEKLGHLMPRPQYGGYEVGTAVDLRLKRALRKGGPVTGSWRGAALLAKRERQPEPEPQDVADRAELMARGYLACGATEGLEWDPTDDRVAIREVEIDGLHVRIGGIPDAVTAEGVPVDLKTTCSEDGRLRTYSRAYGLEDCGPRIARGSEDAAGWLVKRHADWATAAVFYAWLANGWREEGIQARWDQVDGSDPFAIVVRTIDVILPPTFVATVSRRVSECWRAWQSGRECLPEEYRGVPVADLAVLLAP